MDTVFRCIGASNHSEEERADLDFYATSKEAVQKCLDWVKKNLFNDFNNKEWYEPACGQLHIAETIKDNGVDINKIHCSDIVNRCTNPSIPIEVKDFYKMSEIKTHNNVIMTNPPYGKNAERFLKHSIELLEDGDYYISFHRIQFLEGQSRGKIFKENPPRYVLVPSARLKCFKNGIDSGASSAVCFCWFIFKKGFKGKPEIDWI